MFLFDPTPNTSPYMIAGYAVFFTVMVVYLVSLVIRWRNLNQDLKTLESLQAESEAARPKPAPTKK